jgi:hypothetical protein
MAVARHSTNEFMSNGLRRKPTAPASNACTCASSEKWAVMKMIGGHFPLSFKRFCKSKPFIPGIRTSLIRHDVRSRNPDARNASADAKARTSYPRDSNSVLAPLRANLLSSTIEINEMSFVPLLSLTARSAAPQVKR